MPRFQRGDETREAVGIDAQLALLADGFVRLSNREIDDTGEPRDADLERSIHDNPDDDQAWLVYADLLIERGHPRGQLVALESAPVKNIVQRAEREAEARRMRHAAGDLLAGSLAGRSGLNLKWKRGFIHSAKIAGSFAPEAAADLVVDLLAHPSARFLRELEIACFHEDTTDHRLFAALVLHAPAPPPLRRLWIVESNNVLLGDIGALGTVFPQLEQVRLHGQCRLDGLALPRVHWFDHDTTVLGADVVRALATAPWPALHTLDLDCDACTLPFGEFAWVLELPKLSTLRLRGATFANELVAALARHPIAAQIDRLDLGSANIDDEHVALLVKARSRLHAKLRIDARFTAEGRDMLDAANIDYERWWW